MRVVRFLLIFVALSSAQKSTQPGGISNSCIGVILGGICFSYSETPKAVCMCITLHSCVTEKWRQKLQALLFNYRHSASEPRNKVQQFLNSLD